MAYLRGDDLKPKVTAAQPAAPESKLFLYEDIGAAIRLGTLVHGPGATALIDRAHGHGGDANSAVFACLSAICTAYPEAPLRVWRTEQDGKRTHLPDHPLQALLDVPNPAMSGPMLWHWTQWMKHCDGNAYWRKLRAGNPDTGNVVQLWPISPRLIRPWREKDSPNFIDAYRYEYGHGKYEYIAPSNIVHFKLGADDADHRLGMSPLKRLLREILGDEEASRWQASMLGNGGAAGMVVQVPKDSEMSPENAAALKDRIASAFGGDNRGAVGILTGGATMQPYGYSPEQMDMKALHRVPEERIAAVLRVPAIIAGLGAGLDRSTYANFREAREMFAEMTLLPLYTFDAATVNTSLRPDFSSDPRVTTAFDLSDVRALQQDADAQYARLTAAVQGARPWITPNEARSEVGLPPMEGGDTLAVPAAAPAPALPAGAKDRRVIELKAKDLEDLPDLLQALVDLAEPAFQRDLERFQDGQRRRVKRAVQA